jgi:hypothetical protein
MQVKQVQPPEDPYEAGLLLRTYPGMRLLPVDTERFRFAGTLSFRASYGGFKEIHDSFEIEISVPHAYPDQLPEVVEIGGRVPGTFHTNPDGSLCLGSPTRQRLLLIDNPSLLQFVNRCVVPYFYNFSYLHEYGTMPLGELAHGWGGIRQDYADLFDVKTEAAARQMVRLASLKKRLANKHACPCGSGRRLGRCHNRKINLYRTKLGRNWFRTEYDFISTDQ